MKHITDTWEVTFQSSVSLLSRHTWSANQIMSLELEGFAEDFQAKSWHFQRHSSRIRKDEKLLEGCLCMRTFIIDSRMEKNTHESVNDIQLHSCSLQTFK